MISHWDDVDAVHRGSGHISGHWQSLTGETSEWVGVKRIRIDPGSGRRRSTSRARRRRSSSSSTGRASPFRATAPARRRTRSGRGTASCISRSSTRTPSRRGRTGSTSSPSASATTRRTRSSRAPGCRGSARRGCSREAPTTTPGHGRSRSARRRSASCPSGPARIVNVARRRAQGARRRDGRARSPRPGPCRGLGEDRPAALRRCAREARQPAALPQRRGGDLRRPRRRGKLELWPNRRFGGEHETHAVRRGSVVARPAGTGRAAHLPRRRRRDARCSPTGRGTRAT